MSINSLSVCEVASIQPCWRCVETMPHFYGRTDTVYCSVDINDFFTKRGIGNMVLQPLVEMLPDGAYVAGSSVASWVSGDSTNFDDIDIFFNGPEAFEKTFDLFTNPPNDDKHISFKNYHSEIDKSYLIEVSHKIRLIEFKSPNLDRPPVQLIKMIWYDSPEHVIDSFDLTATQFCISNNKLIFNPAAIIDVHLKKIVLHRQQYPVDLLRRIIKYVKKGYSVPPQVLIDVSTQIMEWESKEELSLTSQFY